MLVLSSPEAIALLNAKKEGKAGGVFFCNLGKDMCEVLILADEFLFFHNLHLPIAEVEKIAANPNICFFITEEKAEKIQLFADDTKKFYKLFPTKDWPTLEISGIRMHRVTKVTPKEDTEMKIKLVSPVHDICLDTCMGLGYTAIGLLHAGARSVITVEKDNNCITIAKHNPWSEELFDSNIKIMNGDISEKIQQMKTQSFDRIIHDPPSFALAGELYSLAFYEQLYRVLKRKGKLFHYTGRPGAIRAQRDLLGEVAKRLKKVGFAVRREDTALGVVGWKSQEKV